MTILSPTDAETELRAVPAPAQAFGNFLFSNGDTSNSLVTPPVLCANAVPITVEPSLDTILINNCALASSVAIVSFARICPLTVPEIVYAAPSGLEINCTINALLFSVPLDDTARSTNGELLLAVDMGFRTALPVLSHDPSKAGTPGPKGSK